MDFILLLLFCIVLGQDTEIEFDVIGSNCNIDYGFASNTLATVCWGFHGMFFYEKEGKKTFWHGFQTEYSSIDFFFQIEAVASLATG